MGDNHSAEAGKLAQREQIPITDRQCYPTYQETRTASSVACEQVFFKEKEKKEGVAEEYEAKQTRADLVLSFQDDLAI